ncbi:hypothetical protein CEXT_228171 [Caerostris extrusa]|uniref:Uncharacterized protein n=1 Tax=Caerostris extrusa TaxID=172846 RepID=A0AAV4T235_CAEEX|nr:hypothetical protein CEXT_228171 [Caerostris extrusa]
MLATAEVKPISGFDSQIVIAYVQNPEISRNSDCSKAHKWIRISDSNCIRAKFLSHVVKQRLEYESQIVIAYVQNPKFLKTATVVKPISGFESQIVIANVQNSCGFESQIVVAYVEIAKTEHSYCSRALKWIRISDSNCICAKTRKFLETATAV